MNGTHGRQASNSSNHGIKYGSGPSIQTQPSSKVLLEGYRSSLENPSEDHPRVNPVSRGDFTVFKDPTNLQSSSMEHTQGALRC